jgi:2-succinyl-5-enolpyruvyl-6-hydroxy-3-cyclohexene-1-carboxylate synthase
MHIWFCITELLSIAEAFYSQIPLIVISADRPQSKIDIGDGQTIRQENVRESFFVQCQFE